MTAQEQRVPSTANLLTAAGYVGASLSRQLLGLYELIKEFHGPQEGNTARPMVCTTCRDSRGRKVAWPCPEFVQSAEIMGFRVDPEEWDKLGVSLPASMCLPRAVEKSAPQAIETERQARPTTLQMALNLHVGSIVVGDDGVRRAVTDHFSLQHNTVALQFSTGESRNLRWEDARELNWAVEEPTRFLVAQPAPGVPADIVPERFRGQWWFTRAEKPLSHDIDRHPHMRPTTRLVTREDGEQAQVWEIHP